MSISEKITAVLQKLTELVSGLNGKQDTLTAGENISIQDNVISATGGGGLTLTNIDTQESYNLELQIVNGKSAIKIEMED
ncbi:MAG: hypothetical protein KBT46_08060 [Ruminococcus sp.]|nr:hypothetical protein [Candidatus Copronaster equi]